MDDIDDRVCSNIETTSDKMNDVYDVRAQEEGFPVGELVWFYMTTYSNSRKARFELTRIAEDIKMSVVITSVFKEKQKVGKVLFLVMLLPSHELADYTKLTYQSRWNTLQKLRIQLTARKLQKLAIPRIGCGLDQLDEKLLSNML